MALQRTLTACLLAATTATAGLIPRQYRVNDGAAAASCPGYKASNVQQTDSTLSASLTLAGPACDAYGTDLTDLVLTVEYQTDDRIHVKIQDAAGEVYQVPESVVGRPPNTATSSSNTAAIEFSYTSDPFGFAITRKSNGMTLFNTSGSALVFENQYLRLRTQLPQNPSLYGLGEHTDPLMLNTTNYIRTLWSRDAVEIPPGTNLYGNHPIYYDHRGEDGTHGVFLLNSNGMDIKINNTEDTGQYLEYNTLGGVFDFYFIAGPTPVHVAQQYAEIVGFPAMMPYWGFGFHHCRYGMRDVYEVADVVFNYSAANIPLEVMWTDIDYMDRRRVFTLDPDRFPLPKMRELVKYLHDHQQHYVVMVDPAVAYLDYPPFNRGVEDNAFLKRSNGSIYKGVVWPGVTAFPDWFAPGTQSYWDEEFETFFNPNTGVDIDALWIDMNEASNFCTWPCLDPEGYAIAEGDPPRPPAIRLSNPIPLPGWPMDFQPQCIAHISFNVNATTYFGENILVFGNTVTLGSTLFFNAPQLDASNYPIWSLTVDVPANTAVSYEYVRAEAGNAVFIYENQERTVTTGGCGEVTTVHDIITTVSGAPPSARLAKRGDLVLFSRQAGSMKGLPGRDLLDPPYKINNYYGPALSNKTLETDLIHANGLTMYDTHNMYGTMMSEASRHAMLQLRPTVRPLVITRSTFAGAGRYVGHWLGDNVSDWPHYLISIAHMLQFGALFQLPMVGSDVCGFIDNTNELLCARWATLGAFYPFYRNHDDIHAIPQEFYRWPIVADAARNAISTRYQLLDYIYTTFYEQNQTGTPQLLPMFFKYPQDPKCNALQYQYFLGPGIMVAPVTVENSTSTEIYLPNDIFYDFYTHETIRGTGGMMNLTDVPYTTIPLFIQGGNIIPMRASSANTTTELRKQDFAIIIAPGLDGKASGSLYLDDGVSLVQEASSYIKFHYENNVFSMSGTFDYATDVSITAITVLGGSRGGANLVNSGLKVPLHQTYSLECGGRGWYHGSYGYHGPPAYGS